jgi:hypothetical protein
VLVGLMVGASLGLGIFGVMAYRAVTIDRAAPAEALRRFDAIRAARPGPPLLTLDDAGDVVRREEPRTTAPAPIRRLVVLAYHAETQRLLSADVPFWFLKIKGPAARYALRDTGLDLDRLRLTATDLARHGPSVVIDRVRSNGDRLLVWTQ